MNRNKKNIAVLIGIIILAAGAFLGFYITRVSPVFKEKTFELGESEISNEVSDYINAREFNLNKAVLDTSNVNEKEVGDYTVTCTVDDKAFEYVIHIVDTTAPSIEFTDSLLATFNEYSPENVVVAEDLSAIEKLEFVSCTSDTNSKVNFDDNTLYFETPGTYTIEVVAKDSYGNETNASETIEVVEAPHFILLNDRKYKIGTSFDLINFVYAEDKDGNNITNNITIKDDGGYNKDEAGTYNITYSVVDKDNIERVQTISIEIGDFDENDYGYEKDEFIETLINYDYFSYKPLENNDDLDKVVELTSPTSFSGKTQSSKRIGSFSAFIYRITKNNIYFISNKHCTHQLTDFDNISIYDYNGNFTNIDKKDIQIYKDNKEDIMCFSIPLNTFSLDNLLNYKEILIDANVYNNIIPNQKIFSNCQEHGLPGASRKDKIHEFTVRSTSEKQYEEYIAPVYFLIANEAKVANGESGSPVFDYNGNLVGIVTKTIVGPNGAVDMFTKASSLWDFVNTLEFN